MPPIRVLFAAADPFSYDPTDTYVPDPRLGLDEDLRAILQKVRAAEHRDALKFHPCLATRPDDLLQAMNEVNPHVVHFSGHAGAEGVVLVGSDGRPKHVTAEALARLFRAAGDRLRLVVLSACHTGPIAEAVAQQVGVAVGIVDAWPDASAVAFNASFYRALAFGRPVRQAFEQGLAAIDLEGLDGADLPRLFVRPGVDAGEVVLVRGTDAPRDARGGEQVVNVTGDGNHVYMAGRDLRIGGEEDRPPADAVQHFTNVWYLPKRLRFYQPVNADVGTVLIDGGGVEFRGERSHFTIDGMLDVAHTRQGGDISNNWVRVTYGDPAAPAEAWFSQRTRLGVDPLLGGSAELFAALHARLNGSGTE